MGWRGWRKCMKKKWDKQLDTKYTTLSVHPYVIWNNMLYAKTGSSSHEALHFRLLPSHRNYSVAHQLTCIHIHIPSWGRSMTWVQLCSLCAPQKTECLHRGGRQAAGLTHCKHHPNWGERSVGGARGSFKISLPSDECHLCLPRTPPRPFLMKPDCLLCSASPLILSTGALYNSLMLIVANKSTFPSLPPPSAISHPDLIGAWNALDHCQGAETQRCNEKAQWQTHAHTHVNYLFNKYAITTAPGAITDPSQSCIFPQQSDWVSGLSVILSLKLLQQLYPPLTGCSHLLQTLRGSWSLFLYCFVG